MHCEQCSLAYAVLRLFCEIQIKLPDPTPVRRMLPLLQSRLGLAPQQGCRRRSSRFTPSAQPQCNSPSDVAPYSETALLPN